MKRIFALAVAVALVGLCASNAKAQGVSISSATSPSSGQIKVMGSFSFPSGYSLNGITLFAQPTGEGGGEGGEAGTAVLFDLGSTTSGTYSGTVAVPAGATYDVQALMAITDGSGNVFYYYSAMYTGVQVS
jgi:hypothetical protein